MERIEVAPGTEIGGYRVVGPLGRGGMGAVYRAVDADGVTVALKLLHPHLGADPDARERLEREVRHLQRLRHPGVARVLDAEIDSTEAFVVTELVEGQDLGARVKERGPLAPVELADLAERLRAAIAVVHEAGVLHRDLTPGNVMVTERGPVLIDFGIAQAVDDVRVTSTGLVMGTPGYLSPELLDGAEPSEQADWWGWAALLALAATGRPPFGGPPLQAVLSRARTGQPDVEGLDPRTAAALRGALAVDPWRRTEPGAVVSELRRAAQGETGLAEGTEVVGVPFAAGEGAPVVPPTVVVPAGAAGADGMGGADEADLAETALVGSDGGTRVMPVGGVPDDDAYSDDYDDDYDDDAEDGYDDAYDDGADGAVDETRAYRGDLLDGEPAVGADEGVVEPPPEPARRTGTVLALGAVLVALGAFAPGVALVVGIALAVLVRSVGLDVRAVQRRRARRGAGRGDAATAVVGWPWYLLRALVGVLPAALVAASVVVVVGGVGWWLLDTERWVLVDAGLGERGLGDNAAWITPALLALAVLAGLCTLWFGPMSRTTRTGARWVLRVLAPGRAGAVTAVVLGLAAAAALATLAVLGQDVLWWPLPGPPDLG